MVVFVYLDESGSIHKNSRSKFFAVGGYFTLEKDKLKILSEYKKINKNMKINKNLPLNTEIKAIQMESYEKINIFKNIQDISTFYGFSKVFDKEKMHKEIVTSNLFYNYAVKLVFKDCIIPLLSNINEEITFIVSCDNRTIKVGDINNLENYLNIEFLDTSYSFLVKYYDSQSNYGIQMADLIVNTFYNYFKDYNFIEDVLKSIKFSKFRLSLFPGHIVRGRIRKINLTS